MQTRETALMNKQKVCNSYVFHVLVEKAPEDVVKEEDDQRNAGNLLDNLFRKTKTTPCLYWLPLSDEQVSVVIFSLRSTCCTSDTPCMVYISRSRKRDS